MSHFAQNASCEHVPTTQAEPVRDVVAGLDYMRPEYERLQEVDTVQCIWQQPVPHSRDFEDSSLMNWQAGSCMQAMYQQQLFTDATILVEGHTLPAHRAVLAAASPVFERMFSSHMQEGQFVALLPCGMSLALRSIPAGVFF